MGISVEMDEADKKRLDPQAGSDPLAVKNAKPGYKYRLLNKNQRNLDRKVSEGYEIVQGNDPEQLANVGVSAALKKGSDLDTTRQFNDVVLARMPEELHEKKRKANRAAIDRMTAATAGSFKKEAGDAAIEGQGGGGWSGSMTESEFNSSNKE